MLGTFGGALAARDVTLNKKLTADVRGEIESEDKVLVIKRIHVTYSVDAHEGDREIIERVHGFHADHCPVYRSIYKAIAITSEYNLA